MYTHMSSDYMLLLHYVHTLTLPSPCDYEEDDDTFCTKSVSGKSNRAKEAEKSQNKFNFASTEMR
jgi:hypothetical protein